MISLSHISGLVLGGLLGFIMQRGRFCLAGGLRDFYLFRDGEMIIAILIVISIQSFGLFGLQSLGLVILPYTKFLWLATIVGGILFGSGMALAGSCSTGAYYRTAEGLVGSIIAVIGFILASWFVRLPVSKSFFTDYFPDIRQRNNYANFSCITLCYYAYFNITNNLFNH